jgi:hypothetical protein
MPNGDKLKERHAVPTPLRQHLGAFFTSASRRCFGFKSCCPEVSVSSARLIMNHPWFLAVLRDVTCTIAFHYSDPHNPQMNVGTAKTRMFGLSGF